MKTTLTAAILGLTTLAGVAGAEAQDVHRYRDGHQPRYEQRYEPRPAPRYEPSRERRHGFWGFFGFRTRECAPRVEQSWVAPRYETVIAGYDHCGKPVYNTICVSAGYWTTRACD